jgi:hypothetical protein
MLLLEVWIGNHVVLVLFDTHLSYVRCWQCYGHDASRDGHRTVLDVENIMGVMAQQCR